METVFLCAPDDKVLNSYAVVRKMYVQARSLKRLLLAKRLDFLSFRKRRMQARFGFHGIVKPALSSTYIERSPAMTVINYLAVILYLQPFL